MDKNIGNGYTIADREPEAARGTVEKTQLAGDRDAQGRGQLQEVQTELVH